MTRNEGRATSPRVPRALPAGVPQGSGAQAPASAPPGGPSSEPTPSPEHQGPPPDPERQGEVELGVIREETPREAPLPQRAGLITGLLPAGLVSLDGPLTRFLDRLTDQAEPSTSPELPAPYAPLFVTGMILLEAARRWRKRGKQEPSIDQGPSSGPALSGLS